jgi:hypothetical protein
MDFFAVLFGHSFPFFFFFLFLLFFTLFLFLLWAFSFLSLYAVRNIFSLLIFTVLASGQKKKKEREKQHWLPGLAEGWPRVA